MFVDKVKIYIKAGNGGNGAISFRREKYVPAGGPDGGDGGKGGDVIFVVNTGKHTLADFRFKKSFKARNGEDGRGRKMFGKKAEDIIIEVPPGTIVRDAETNKVIADLVEPRQRKIAVYGGRGGRGNARYATATKQAPRFAKEGQKGQELWVTLELKSIADVGLIGFPNVGKSTILSVLSASRPKIADYHFTTLSPNLGVVNTRFNKSFIMADIPGLIEGAHKGAGLGIDFLKHIERTRLLVHVLDASGVEGRDPVEDFYTINRELESFSKELAQRPQIVAANKIDLPSAQENIDRLEDEIKESGIKVFPISAAADKGFDKLLSELVKVLDELPPIEPLKEEWDWTDEDTEEKPFEIEIEEGIYIVSGPIVDRLLGSVNLEDYESLQYFQRSLRRNGIIDALREAGIDDGDTVRMQEIEFDFID
ncbi:MAG: GTPase ObgE [Clostridiales bacterium]|nr:GTPase ObgE [Clostridiales bacterium]